MKTITELIDEGYEIKKNFTKSGYMGKYIFSEKYQNWLVYCTRYLQKYYPEDLQKDSFIKIAQDANGQGVDVFDKLVAILTAIQEIPLNNQNNYLDIDYILKMIFENFHRCASSLFNRYGKRETLKINDEYDVQDLLEGILRLFIDDVRPEDYVPSYAGGNSRTDFYLPKYNTFIEVKMTREGLTDKEIGNQLSIDIARYSSMCDTLICFIYNKNDYLHNPFGLMRDLEKLSSNRLNIKVYISPL